MFFLANSPHPILDGVEEEAASNRTASNVESTHDIPVTTTYYPTDSEFIYPERKKCDANAIADECAKQVFKDDLSNVKVERRNEEMEENELDRPRLGRREEMRKTMLKQQQQSQQNDYEKNNNNLSDDEGMQTNEFDDDTAEIPTLETYVPREPSYDKANAIPFAQVCQRLEYLWKVRLNAKKRILTKQQKLEILLPDALKQYLDGGSPFPYLRLILAEHDSSRPHTGLKEVRIAETWAKAMGCDAGSEAYKQLKGFREPNIIKNPNSVGDLSCVVQDVITERLPASGSKLTVGEVNEWLDVLVEIVKDKFGMAVEDRIEKSAWRKTLEKAILSKKSAKKHEQYSILVEKLIDKNMSPVEHKFIVRIILQHIHVGINLKEVLGYMNAHAMDIHYSSNSLNDLCSRLSDPEYVRLLKATVDKNTKEIMESNRQIWMTPSNLPAQLQNTISPMLSRRTSFQTFLKEIALRHSQLDKALPADSPAKSCLAIKHPAFACEIKMDGERDLVHIKRGIVTIQTRNGTWYSPLYSPAIGPSLRAAIAAYDVDVILDGEMIAWDGIENRPIPFGSNRTVAEMNRNQRSRDGTQDVRDLGLHKFDTNINVMTIAKDKAFKELNTNKHTSLDMSATTNVAPWGICSNKYWLQYVIFDILYVDGPGAKGLLSKVRHLFGKEDTIQPGSLINMDCMQRKCILYHLIKPQDKVVEHIRSVIIRSDGTRMDPSDYFLATGGLEYGMTPCEIDSIYVALCDKSGTTKFDTQRCGKTHEEIEIRRSLELESLYNQIVSLGGQEGLIFKDLASPYYLGAKSRTLGYWWKLKPDYDASGTVADIDCLVLAGKFADGLDRRGLLSSLLVGCLSTEHRYGGLGAKYMVLTKVNFAKDVENVLSELTGLQRADESGAFQLGKWFESNEIPDFISSESHQRGFVRDELGWIPESKDRPDVWIKPADSFVVTINAAELQTSHAMQAGFTLRFPRITKVRGKGSEDPKNADDVADWSQLQTLFIEQEENRQDEVSFGSQQQQQTSRFLTAKQLLMSTKQKAAKKSRKQTNEVKQFHIPEAGETLSSALDGFSFCVLPGNYCLENDSYAAAQAEENRWATESKLVKRREDVIRYIQSHGGTCQLAVHMGTNFVLGGTPTDASVSNLRTLMEKTDKNSTAKKDADARRLLELGGVIKWTFVYSIVSQFLTSLSDVTSSYRRSIKDDWPSLASARASDFLAVSDTAKLNLQSTEDVYGLRINEVAGSLDFCRALEEVGRHRQKQCIKGIEGVPWQVMALHNFNDNERWMFGGKLQKLWPYVKNADENASKCILYPDLFDDLGYEDEVDANKEALDFNKSLRWEDDIMVSKSLGYVAATLPLAKALGAIVTPHLHTGVTHILCDLARHKMLKWSSRHPLSIYTDSQSGSRLHERLISLEEISADWPGVLLVSPTWLEDKWNED